jgi:hypothetical protein
MQKTERARRSVSDVARDRAAVRDMVPGLIALVIAQGSLILVDPEGDASGWTLVWSLVPLVPALWLVWAQWRSLRRADEYQRIVQLEALAFGFATVMVISLTAGLLDGAGIGEPTQFLQITFIGGVLAWIGALAVLMRRGR